MKIIVPVAGVGSNLRPHTHTQPKALMPVAGKPILSHIIDYLSNSGLEEFIFVIGHLGDKIESFVKNNYPKMKSTFVVQEPREGLGHAVWLTRKNIKENDELLIVLGDTIFDFDLNEIISQPVSMIGIRKVDDPREYGVAEVAADGFISKTIEKPPIPKSNLAIVGIYYIKEGLSLMEALDHNIKQKIKTHGEYHLADGIQRMIEKGTKIRTFQVGNWFDCGTKDKLLDTNSIFLKRLEEKEQKTFRFPNTIITHPVSIAGNCDISDSIIGPNVTIGENSVIRHSIVKESIIGAFSQLDTAILYRSVVGNDTFLKGLSQSLNIGDSNEIDFS